MKKFKGKTQQSESRSDSFEDSKLGVHTQWQNLVRVRHTLHCNCVFPLFCPLWRWLWYLTKSYRLGHVTVQPRVHTHFSRKPDWCIIYWIVGSAYLAWIYLLVTINFHLWMHFSYSFLWHFGYCSLMSWSSYHQESTLGFACGNLYLFWVSTSEDTSASDTV